MAATKRTSRDPEAVVEAAAGSEDGPVHAVSAAVSVETSAVVRVDPGVPADLGVQEDRAVLTGSEADAEDSAEVEEASGAVAAGAVVGEPREERAVPNQHHILLRFWFPRSETKVA